MAVRQSVVLKEHGYAGSLADYRRALVEIKDRHFPAITDEELTYTRDEADAFCDAVRKRVGLPTLPRPFILRSLISERKHPLKA